MGLGSGGHLLVGAIDGAIRAGMAYIYAEKIAFYREIPCVMRLLPLPKGKKRRFLAWIWPKKGGNYCI